MRHLEFDRFLLITNWYVNGAQKLHFCSACLTFDFSYYFSFSFLAFHPVLSPTGILRTINLYTNLLVSSLAKHYRQSDTQIDRKTWRHTVLFIHSNCGAYCFHSKKLFTAIQSERIVYLMVKNIKKNYTCVQKLSKISLERSPYEILRLLYGKMQYISKALKLTFEHRSELLYLMISIVSQIKFEFWKELSK